MRPPPGTMLAMVCDGPGQPLRAERRPLPAPGAGEVLVEVLACGVCRTDLHVTDGEIPARYPVVPGHEIVGRVLATGAGVTGFAPGLRIGVPWLGKTCGTCEFCRSGRENLCDAPEFTGATRDGGYASHALADHRFCFPLPADLPDAEAAPLLCAGLIGWRAYRMTGLDGAILDGVGLDGVGLDGVGLDGAGPDGVGTGEAGPGAALGLYGFGAAAHILAQLAVARGLAVYAFTRPGDSAGQDFARSLGCGWAGGADELPPRPLDAAILFAPVGALVPAALKAVKKGGRVICAGIHMSDIPAFPYADLWGERQIRSVANLTRADGAGFLVPEIAGKVRSHVVTFPLAQANEALRQLRAGEFSGAAVLLP